MMLHPEDLGVGGTLHQAMHVLANRVELQFLWNVFGSHSLAAHIPGFSAVSGDPNATGRDSDADVLRVAWVNAYRMNARPLGSIRSPQFPFRMIPQRTVQLPRITIVFLLE